MRACNRLQRHARHVFQVIARRGRQFSCAALRRPHAASNLVLQMRFSDQSWNNAERITRPKHTRQDNSDAGACAWVGRFKVVIERETSRNFFRVLVEELDRPSVTTRCCQRALGVVPVCLAPRRDMSLVHVADPGKAISKQKQTRRVWRVYVMHVATIREIRTSPTLLDLPEGVRHVHPQFAFTHMDRTRVRNLI